MSKYYTPSIEEFHVGFECEISQSIDRVEWVNYTVTPSTWSSNAMWSLAKGDPTLFRVKCLDREDVENILKEFTYEIGDIYCSGGWSKDYLDSLEWYIEGFNSETGHDLFIFKNKDKELINIEDDETFIFTGRIRNKSELKILLKQLGVNE